jgi:hypothetical protein
MSIFKSKIEEAYRFTLRKIEELRSKGIASYIEKSYSADDESTIRKYDYDWVLPHENWIRVIFTVETRENLNLVMDCEEAIRQIYGVYFDTGFGGNFREWELDWSFQLTNRDNING